MLSWRSTLQQWHHLSEKCGAEVSCSIIKPDVESIGRFWRIIGHKENGSSLCGTIVNCSTHSNSLVYENRACVLYAYNNLFFSCLLSGFVGLRMLKCFMTISYDLFLYKLQQFEIVSLYALTYRHKEGRSLRSDVERLKVHDKSCCNSVA